MKSPRLTKPVREALDRLLDLAHADIEADRERWTKAELEAFERAELWLRSKIVDRKPKP